MQSSLLVGLCGIYLRLEIFSERQVSLPQQWGLFRADGREPVARLILHILSPTQVEEVPATTPLLPGAPIPTRYSCRAWGASALPGKGMSEVLAPDNHCLEVFLPYSDQLTEDILRLIGYLLARVLGPRPGMLVHGAGLAFSEGCALVTGPSGAGKSTSTRMIAPDLVLSDDMVGITGTDSEPVLWATPLGRLTDGPFSGPLRAIFFPKKAPGFSIEPLRPLDAFLKYWSEHFDLVRKFFHPCEASYFRNAYDLFQKVPAYELAFALDDLDREAVRDVLLNSQARSSARVHSG